MEEKKYLDYEGLQTYHTNLCNIIEDNEQVTAAALDNLDDRLKEIETENPYSKLEIDDLLEPITDKLDNIEDFAEVNVLSDWNETNSDSDAYIKNKPNVKAIEDKIPSTASSTNQLADKEFVNSSISTSTATFRGTSATGLTETQFLTWANGLTKDANDYVFWNTIDSSGTPQFKRYKYNGTAWVYEYTLNNSSFTAEQWATIQSRLTSNDKTKLDGIENGATKVVESTISGWGFTKNEGTITGINMNGASKGTSGVVDLGTIITDVSDKADKSSTVSNVSYDTTNKKITKTINGTTSDVVTSEKVVEDGGGMNLVEGYYYNKKFYKEAAHTTEITGTDGRIYIDKDTNREYRFDGTKYVLLKSEVDGSFVNEGTFTYRPTAGALDVESGAVGEGGAQIESVKGNTIAWNQFANGIIGDLKGNLESIGLTVTVDTDGNYILNGTISANAAFNFSNNTIQWVSGHKYCCINNTANGINLYATTAGINTVNGAKWLMMATSSGSQMVGIYIEIGNTLTNFKLLKPQIIDLTLIYGEGNEPTTVEQFEADYQKWFGKPLTYEEYDEGSLRSVEMTGIKTVGFNLWDGDYPSTGVFTNNCSYSVSGDEVTVNVTDSDAYIGNQQSIRDSYSIFNGPLVKVLPNSTYHFHTTNENFTKNLVWAYNKERVCVGTYEDVGFGDVDFNFVTPADCYYVSFRIGTGYQISSGSYTTKININLSHSGDRNGDYEPYWEHTASLPVTSLKGKLNGEGESVVIFPDGMKSGRGMYTETGKILYDEIKTEGKITKAIKRFNSIDLGTLDYYLQGDSLFASVMPSDCSSDSYYLMCAKYTSTFDVPRDKKVSIWGGGGRNLRIKDTNYTDATTFKAAMSGVMLYYELATPQEYIIDDIDFPTEYPVDDYGTEEILSNSAKSLAPTLDIRYGLNATDTLRNLPSKYVSAVEEQNFTEAQKERARVNIGAVGEDVSIVINALTRHTRLTDFDLSVLKQAVADGNLEKYGLKVGDEKTINGHTYVIAGLNPMKGVYEPYRVNNNHVGLIVIPHVGHVWNESGNTYTGSNDRGAGYKNSDLHAYLKSDILPMCQTDLGTDNLIAHNKLLSSAVNTNGYNRFGTASGCSSSWGWEENCYISALSEVQVYGSIVWSSSGYDTGEACRQLDVFRVYNMNEIFGWEYPWLRDIASSSFASCVNVYGRAIYYAASYGCHVAALILFN